MDTPADYLKTAAAGFAILIRHVDMRETAVELIVDHRWRDARAARSLALRIAAECELHLPPEVAGVYVDPAQARIWIEASSAGELLDSGACIALFEATQTVNRNIRA